MASFDFIEASAKGYEFSWRERSYLVRAAAPVFFVKFVCLLFLRFLQIEDYSLIGGLVAMPAHILEAIFMISVVRYIAFREPLFEFRRVLGARFGAEEAPAHSNPQMFKAGVAMYLLIKIVQLGFVGWTFDYGRALGPAAEAPVPEQNLVSAIVVLSLTCIMLWAFRLLWLYIPVSMGYTVRGFLLRIKGMMSSLHIFATWFVCHFPLVVLIYGIFTVSNLVVVPDTVLQVLVHDVIRTAGDIFITLVQVAAMTYGFIEVLTNKKKSKG